MKTITSHLRAVSLALLSVLSAPLFGEVAQSSTASTAGIAVDRTEYFTQATASAPTHTAMPFSFNFNIRGTSQDMTNWGPGFYKPGSGGVPQTGTSSATNTGTLNFSTAPNNSGGGYMFSHDFATDSELVAAYPLGAYGVKFQGTAKPTTPQTDNPFTAGLAFAASGSTYPSVTPQISNADNGALWYSGGLKLKSTGVTTLTLNTFPEYSSSTYGSVITAGIYGPGGNVISSASVEAYYLPTLGVNQPAVTQLTLDGAWLTPGVNYTLEIQYIIIASAPQEGYLNNENFQGVSSYIKNTSVTVSLQGAARSAPSDFNGDGQSDILWQNSSNGNVYMWLMNGTGYSSYHYVTTMTSEWRAAGTGDFNGDGKADIVWHNTVNGNTYIWYMDGPAYTSYEYVTTMPPPWQLAAVGDFNGDGKADIVWRNSANGYTYVWLMNGASYSSYGFLTQLGAEWRIGGTGDFNGDGKSDLLWQNTATGASYVWMMNGLEYTSYSPLTTMSTDWLLVGNADFNADGKGDIMWRNTVNGNIYIWLMNGTNYSSYEFLTNMSPEWRIAN